MPIVPAEVDDSQHSHVIEEILAVHNGNGIPHALVSWEGHRVLTWELASEISGSIMSTDGLEETFSSDAVLQGDNPVFYNFHVGELRSLECCDHCSGYSDGQNNHLYVDASKSGNVSIFMIPCFDYGLIRCTQFTRLIVSVHCTTL